MQTFAYFGLFIPLAGFLLLMASSFHITRFWSQIIGCGTILLSFLSFAAIFFIFNGEMGSGDYVLYKWISFYRLHADIALHVDSLSLLMTLIITGVGFLIHVYSIGYMEHDEDYARYFACMNLFVFAMLLLVLSSSVLLLFVGWEGVGLASYLLIGFWYHRPSAAQAATKAFVVNRVGDAGFLLALLLTFSLFGTTEIQEIAHLAQTKFAVGDPILIVLTLLFFVGAVGKSAQIPLHVWLPDAMEGPTPVSALIHAATMVTAGIYLVVRLHVLFMMAPTTLYIIGTIGGLTALFAALSATAQTDLKRVLAYSTVSQLGLMFLGCGVGAFYAAMFHLTTHAFMKALLFLSAGNVIHMMQGTTDMGKMGGLAKKLKITHWMFLVGVLAMSGVPPLAAFFSKDLILEQDYLAGVESFFYIGLIASILTAFYLTRAYVLTFLGEPRLNEKIFKMIKEAPLVMIIPVFILALLSFFGGFLGFAFGKMPWLEDFLAKADITEKEAPGNFLLNPLTWFSVAGAILGVGAAAILYSRYANKLKSPLNVLRKAFYVDELYEKIFVQPTKTAAKFIDNRLEPDVFESSIDLAAHSTHHAAGWLQKGQSGQIRSYIAWMALGAALFIIYIVL